MNYYNDNDPKAAAWLRELIKQNIIPSGDVDERSIADVTGSDLKGYTQVHMFAGIGGWSEALRLAGWPTTRPVWSGSCPCQPFSSAGKRQGTKDKRHLWPEFYRLIAECKPNVIFGEQVERAIGLGWLDGVFTDLENEGYTCGAAVLGAHSLGAPHIRQRLYWVADTESGRNRRNSGAETRQDTAYQGVGENASGIPRYINCGLSTGRVADTEHKQHQGGISGRQQEYSPDEIRPASEFTGRGEVGGLENTQGKRLEGRDNSSQGISPEGSGLLSPGSSEPSSSFWSNSVWLPCADGKARRIEPAFFPLADGIPGRVAMLRGFGNAIVPQVAAEFVRAYMEARNDYHQTG